MLKRALATTLVLGFLTPLAQADLIKGDPIDIVGTFDGEAVWGSPFEGAHLFGDLTFYVDQILGSTIVVDSFELLPPRGKTFAGRIDIIYLNPNYLDPIHFEEIDISGIKEPGGSNFINSVEVVGNLGQFADVSTDGFNIHFEAFSLDIRDVGGLVSIVWTQVGDDTCPWDIDSSGGVGTADLLDLLSQWGDNPGGPPDFDGSGSVGTADLLKLLSNWGRCPK